MPKKKKSASKQEVTKMGQIIRGIGALGGSTLGNLIGYGEEGKTMGRDLGAALSRWLGTGDYSVRVNSLVTNSSASIPQMHKTGQSIVVRHKEYLCDVISGSGTPTEFTIGERFYLNPGLSSTFPWLSTIASQFQEYTWRGMVFHYVPTSGHSVASTNTALGTVMLHTDYRVTAPQPTSKMELLNEYFAGDARPSESFCHPIECDPKENPYNVQYVRTGAVPSGEDPKSYDLGVLNVATQGFPAAATTAGELWVTYEVELRKPQISVGGPTASSNIYSSSGIDNNHCLGTAQTYHLNELGLTITNNLTYGRVNFPKGSAGKYLIWIHWRTGTSSGVVTPGLRELSNLRQILPAETNYGGGSYLHSLELDGEQAVYMLGVPVEIINPSLSAYWGLTTFSMVDIEYVSIVVTRLSPNFL
jgi:hypothetical protein